MIEFGKTLRTAREAKGYTIAQLADMTKLNPSTIADLENEDFSRIAAPIYGRGFIKLYCEAVGLEPKPLVIEFMEILNGNREPQIRERTTAETPPEPTPEPIPEPTPASAPEQPPEPAAETDVFRLEAEIQPAPAPVHEDLPSAQETSANPAVSVDVPTELPHPDPLSEPRKTQSLSRYATPMDERPLATGLAALNLRIVVLAGILIAILVAVLFGLRALYRATTDAPVAEAEQETSAPAETTAEDAPAPASVPAKARTPQRIPDVYID